MRQVCCLLGKRYPSYYPGARLSAGGRNVSTLIPAAPVFYFCFLDRRRVRIWGGWLCGVGLEVGKGTEKRGKGQRSGLIIGISSELLHLYFV